MVDAELYRNILLAVAARKKNERSLATVAEKPEQHIEQIENSNGRIMKEESDMLERMSQRINESFDVLRDEHNTRMKNVMADIRALRLRYQVERYDHIFPICQAQVKDMEQLNRKLRADLLEEKHRNETDESQARQSRISGQQLGNP